MYQQELWLTLLISNKYPKRVTNTAFTNKAYIIQAFSEIPRFSCSELTLIKSLFRENSDYSVPQSLDKCFVGTLFEMSFSQMLWGTKGLDTNQH